MALAGNNNNNDGFGAGFGGGWWVILFILLIFGGWGGRGWGGNNGGGGNDGVAAMPDSSIVFKAYLQSIGYVCHALPNTCPICYTISDFCKDHPKGIYILCSGEHVVTVINGNYYDNGNSGDEVPLYFYTKE